MKGARTISTGWQRQYAASRDVRSPSEKRPRRLVLLESRFNTAQHHFGELLFALYVCRDSRLDKKECEKEYLFRVRNLQEILNGSASWRNQYQRHGNTQDEAGAIETKLWQAREVFTRLLASMEACQRLSGVIWEEECRGLYESYLEELAQTLVIEEASYRANYFNER